MGNCCGNDRKGQFIDKSNLDRRFPVIFGDKDFKQFSSGFDLIKHHHLGLLFAQSTKLL